MQVNKNNITQYLTATHVSFMIPVYQRNYDWKESNCKQLFNDIWYVSQSSSNKTHFLGTICSKTQNSHEKTIIDGQQRLTSITLLVKAMHDYVENEDFKKSIDSNFLHNNGYGVTPEHAVKLHLNKRDDAIYNQLLSKNTFTQSSEIGSEFAKSSIYANYAFFYESISGLSEAQINEVLSALDRMIIVDLDVEGENPQEIFESLNSTGLDLTDVDLLRNYLLMSLEYKTQVRLYDEYWFKIEECVGPENMVRFFVDYLIYVKKSDAMMLHGRRAHINERNLYSAFRDYYNSLAGARDYYKSSPDITEMVLKDMLSRAQVYKRLIFDERADFKQLKSPIDRVLYSIVCLNGAITSRPVLMYVLEKYENGFIAEDVALKMLNACLSLVFRAKVSGGSGINGQFSGNMLQKLPESDFRNVIDDFWKAITSGSGKYEFPSDAAFKNALTERNIYEVLRSRGVKYLLYSLELNECSAKGLPEYNDPNTTIEHIMPKTLNDDWVDGLGDGVMYHHDFLNKLGNLALTSNNPEMQNKSFAKKKDWYEHSSFYLTRILSDSDFWAIQQITNRGKKLANKCTEIWSIPSKYQQIAVYSDEEGVARRKPFKFDMIGLVPGDEVVFAENHSKVAVVFDNAHVLYEGETYSLSGLAAKLLGREFSAVQGPKYFMYDGQILADMRDDVETNMF